MIMVPEDQVRLWNALFLWKMNRTLYPMTMKCLLKDELSDQFYIFWACERELIHDWLIIFIFVWVNLLSALQPAVTHC